MSKTLTFQEVRKIRLNAMLIFRKNPTIENKEKFLIARKNQLNYHNL